MITDVPVAADPGLGPLGGLRVPGGLGPPGTLGPPGGQGPPGSLGTPGGLTPGADLSGVGFQVPRGDPTELDGLTVTLGEYEQLLHDHGATIQTTADCAAPSWTGEAAQAYANLSGLVSAHFHHAANTAADARGALQRWSAELHRCQREGLLAVTEAEHWLAEIRTYQQALTTARGQITTSQQALATAQTKLATAAPAHTGAATAHLVGAVGAAQSALTTAQTAAQTARTTLDHAHHQLAIWQARGRQAWQDAETAAETAAGTLGPLFITPPPLAGLPTPLSPIPPFAQPPDPSCQNEDGSAANAKPGGLPGQLRNLAASIAGISPGAAAALLALAKALEDGEGEEQDGSGLLTESEAAGGHTLLKHVGQSDADLAARLSRESELKRASTFYDRYTADSEVEDVVATNRNKIQDWLSGTKPKVGLAGRAAEPIGRSLARGSTEPEDVSGVRVVLQRDPALPAGYRVLTAYPEP